MTDFMKSRGMEEDRAEDRHLWRLGVDRRLLAVYIYIYIFIYLFIYLFIIIIFSIEVNRCLLGLAPVTCDSPQVVKIFRIYKELLCI